MITTMPTKATIIEDSYLKKIARNCRDKRMLSHRLKTASAEWLAVTELYFLRSDYCEKIHVCATARNVWSSHPLQ